MTQKTFRHVISALALLLLAVLRQGLFCGIHFRLKGCHQLLDLLVAIVDWVAIAPIQRQSLFESEDGFGSPSALQRFPDGLRAGLDPRVAQLGRHGGIALPGYDGIQTRQPRPARDVRDDVWEL